jgi:uncharacterized SAM-binding protein YcdF (DUF218 family)
MPKRWYERTGDTWLPRASRSYSRWLILLIAVLVVISYHWWLGGLARALIVDQAPVKANAILVLGGGDGSRQDRAIQLYQAGWATHIVSCGAKPDLPDIERTVAKMGADYMAARGIPREDIMPMETATDTYEEAVMGLSLARTNGFASLLVVTDAQHTGRASLVFRHVFRGSNVRLVFVAAYPAWLPLDAWWTQERAFGAVAEEYGKLVFYLFRGYLF